MKRNGIVFIAVFLLLVSGVMALTAFCDPFFQYGAPGEREVYKNERFQNGGLAMNGEYSELLVGTSNTANFRASWFGGDLMKLTFPDGYMSDFDRVLESAYEHHGISRIYFGADLNILIRPESGRTTDLPEHLYTSTFLDDGEYLLNRDVVFGYIIAGEDEKLPLDEAFCWEGYGFSEYRALVSYARPAVKESGPNEDAYIKFCDENIAVITSWAEKHPESELRVFISPYSMLFWDRAQREKTTDALLFALDHSVRKLASHENIDLWCFADAEEIICDLNNYTDAIHCSPQVEKLLAEAMMSGEGKVELSSWGERLESFRELLSGWDYDGMFAKIGG